MTKSAATQNDTATVGAQFIAPEASPEHGQKGGVSGWRECKLGDVAEITSSKRIFYSDYVSSGIQFWRSKEVIEQFNRKSITTDLFISLEKYQEIKSKFGVPQVNDILLTSVGTLGIPYLVKQDDEFYFKDGNLTWIKNIDNEVLHPLYLYKWLASETGRDSLREITIGSTQEALTIAGLKTLALSIPTLPEQKAIAAVLSSLDDKIDLLHHQNQTLEAMAQTLFRQWFIEEAREDWEEVTLANLCKVITKGTTPTTLGHSFVDDGVNFIKAESITDDGGFIKEKFAKINLETHKLLNRSVILKSDVLCSIAGTIGRVAMVEDWILPANTNQAIAILRTNEQRCFPQFIYLFLKSSSFQDAMDGKIVHAVQPNLSLGQIGSTNLRLPPYGYLCDFVELVKPMFEKKTMNLIQIQTLTQLRDTLLPKLMSGEIRVEVEYE